MHKKIISLIFVAILGFSLPQNLLASKIESNIETSSSTLNEEYKSNRALSLMNRINEIKAMDRSALTSSEKKELRKELRTIKKEFKKEFKGVYLSVSAIIIVLLLLILLL
ncbi:MAG: hypothetical protein KGZ59_11995 [Chitinophagaceae bacterium]|nr:hypothetical protein [Chitinophagaceae bacterium]